MKSKSFSLSVKFNTEIRRFLFVTDKVDTADLEWKNARKELDELAEKEIQNSEFWGDLIKLFTQHGFYQVRE